MNQGTETVKPQLGRTGRIEGLALGKQRLGQRVGGGLRVWELATWKPGPVMPLAALSALGSLADGSLLAIARTGTGGVAYHFALGGEVTQYPVRLLVHDELQALVPDASAPRRFWLLAPDRRDAALYELPAAPGFVRLLQTAPLAELGRSDVVTLGDGTLCYSAFTELHQVGPLTPTAELPPRAVAWEPVAAELLAPGPTPDTLWAAASTGSITRVQLPRGEKAPRAVSERVLQVAGPIFQLESAPGVLAILRVEPGDTALPGFSLVVLDEQGQTRWTAALPGHAGAGTDSNKSLVERQSELLAAHCVRATAEFVAVGGPDHLTVFAARSGKVLCDHPAG